MSASGKLNHWAGEEVERLLRQLPAPLRARAAELPIVLQNLPTRAQLDDGVEPDLMGLFEGDTCAEEAVDLMPSRVYLFLENIWEEADHDPDAFREEVRVTLMHELGHYLGLDESDLADRGLE
jgi:predicted Zn-dependent protease with MMP-like domain